MLESALHYVTTQNPVIWSLNLPWLEYAQIDLTHLEPFEASLGHPCFMRMMLILHLHSDLGNGRYTDEN